MSSSKGLIIAILLGALMISAAMIAAVSIYVYHSPFNNCMRAFASEPQPKQIIEKMCARPTGF